jgi:hypothetical protein
VQSGLAVPVHSTVRPAVLLPRSVLPPTALVLVLVFVLLSRVLEWVLEHALLWVL